MAGPEFVVKEQSLSRHVQETVRLRPNISWFSPVFMVMSKDMFPVFVVHK